MIKTFRRGEGFVCAPVRSIRANFQVAMANEYL